jgi:phytoene synthase
MSDPAVSPTVADAYAACEAVTRQEAKNFSYGIRLLPAPKRAALSAVYALSRRLDDIGDGGAPDEEKLALLAAARTDIAGLSLNSSDPVMVALADASSRFPIPIDAFIELIEGVEMDVQDVQYETFEELVGYCRRVAGTIGRLSLGIFGTATRIDPAAAKIADDLGIALQQTNILRDVREDLLLGRIYLPRAELARAGIVLEIDAAGELGGPREPLLTYLRDGARRAQQWYDRGLRLLDLLDRRSSACCGAMAGIYLRLNRRISIDPTPVLRERMALPGWEKAIVAARSLAGRPERPEGVAA